MVKSFVSVQLITDHLKLNLSIMIAFSSSMKIAKMIV